MKNKKTQVSPNDEEKIIDILNKVAKRVEDATIDIHDLRFDLKSVKLELRSIEHNTSMMKVDIEKLRDQIGEAREELKMTEDRLNRRITNVGDLITINLGQKVSEIEKRVTKIEKSRQVM